MPDLQLLAELMVVTAALSGYPAIPVQQLPPIRVLTSAEMTQEVCPQRALDCVRIVAHFDAAGPQIRLSDTLDLEFAQGRSFLVHELVHVLQHHHGSLASSSDCAASLRSEQEAYRVQNAYLRLVGVPGRHGQMIANMGCAAEQRDDSGLQLEPRRSGRDDSAAFDQFMEARRRTGRDNGAADAGPDNAGRARN
jgi:hypothetical protein